LLRLALLHLNILLLDLLLGIRETVELCLSIKLLLWLLLKVRLLLGLVRGLSRSLLGLSKHLLLRLLRLDFLGRLLGNLAQKLIELLLGELDELLLGWRARPCLPGAFDREWHASSQVIFDLCEGDPISLLACEVGDRSRGVNILLNQILQEVVH